MALVFRETVHNANCVCGVKNVESLKQIRWFVAYNLVTKEGVMNKVLKKALGFAGALGLTAVMVLAAAPVQASDVDARIQVLERELVQLKQNQESALAAEMKGPSFKYSAGKGLTIAAADNNWSINFTQRLQVYHSIWLSKENPDKAATRTWSFACGVFGRRSTSRPSRGFTRSHGSSTMVAMAPWLRRRRIHQLRQVEPVSPAVRLGLQSEL